MPARPGRAEPIRHVERGEHAERARRLDQGVAPRLEVADLIAHLAALVFVWLCFVATGIWLGRYTLMYAQTGLMAGPGMAEVTVTLPLLAVQTGVTLAAAVALTLGLLRGRVTWLVGGGAAIVLGGLVASSLPGAYHRLVVLPNELVLEGPFLEHHITATRRAFLLDGIEDYRPDEPVLFYISVLRFAEPYSGPVVAALGSNGVDIRFDDECMVRQTGRRREASGDEPRRLLLLEGLATTNPPAGSRPIAVVDGLTDDQRTELAERREAVLTMVREEGLELNDDGRAARAAGRIDLPDVVFEPGADAAEFEAGGFLAGLPCGLALKHGGGGLRFVALMALVLAALVGAAYLAGSGRFVHPSALEAG